jgi:hypothetical protein
VGVRFSAPVQTGPGAYPASCTMGTGSWVKRPGRGVDHPPLSSTEVKEKVELYLYSLSGASWPVIGKTLLYSYLPEVLEPTEWCAKGRSVLTFGDQLINSDCHVRYLCN